ncbi:MAG: hypothetical protein OXG05_05950 [Gammaproteobacteria bacterium]|nr:hypothetical protein [Gammaproteobacteria bacterium]
MDRIRSLTSRYLQATLTTLLSLATAFVQADEIDPHYAKFLEANLSQDHVACSYMTTHSSKESGERVERFSPETLWQLVTVDGLQPSKRELADYAKDADERSQRRNHPTDLEFLKMVVADTVRVDQENDETVEFVFLPEMGDEIPDRMEEKMTGRLIVTKDGFRPLKFSISLTEPASPIRGVKMQKLEQETTFTSDRATGVSLTKSMSFEAAGRAFFVTKIDQNEQIEFSDFDCKVVAAQTAGS